MCLFLGGIGRGVNCGRFLQFDDGLEVWIVYIIIGLSLFSGDLGMALALMLVGASVEFDGRQ